MYCQPLHAASMPRGSLHSRSQESPHLLPGWPGRTLLPSSVTVGSGTSCKGDGESCQPCSAIGCSRVTTAGTSLGGSGCAQAPRRRSSTSCLDRTLLLHRHLAGLPCTAWEFWVHKRHRVDTFSQSRRDPDSILNCTPRGAANWHQHQQENPLALEKDM